MTERFGMETRTELILLQRTMVVVEGVARSLDPQMNIWKAAQPVVEDYIKDSIGPRAIARDLIQTAKVFARFGPRLPQLAEEALIRSTNPQPDRREPRLRPALGWMSLGAILALSVSWGIAFLW